MAEEVFLCTAPVPRHAGQGVLQEGAELMLQAATPARFLNEAGHVHVQIQVGCIWHQGLVSELHLKTVSDINTCDAAGALRMVVWSKLRWLHIGWRRYCLASILKLSFLFVLFIITRNKTYQKPLDPAFPFPAFFSVNEFNTECFYSFFRTRKEFSLLENLFL